MNIKLKVFSILTIISLLTLTKTYSDDDFSKIEYKANPLTKSLYMLKGAGGNITWPYKLKGRFTEIFDNASR